MRKLLSPEPDLLKPNAFGFPSVWVPFGKETTIEGLHKVYEVKKDNVLDPKSIDSLVGIPVYCSHPGIHTYENADNPEFLQVGVVRDVWRESEDGLGGEVLCRITSSEVYQLLLDKTLVEASPAYKMEGRIFNHLGLFKKGGSRGGSIMTILLEGKDEYLEEGFQHQKVPYSNEVYTIQLDTTSVRGEVKSNLVDSVQLPLVKSQSKQTEDYMEQLIKDLTSKLDAFIAKEEQTVTDLLKNDIILMEGKVSNAIKAVEEAETKAESQKDVAFKTGFLAGQKAGETIFTAKSLGFIGEGLDRAIEFVVAKAFPTIALEGKDSSFTESLFDGAVKELNRQAELVKTAVIEKSVTENILTEETVMEGKETEVKVTEPKLPTMSGNETTKTLPSRYKLVEATL
jgi:hypothetical protein